MPTLAVLYHGYRFAGTIISHCVWLYFRFNLSLREVQEIIGLLGADQVQAGASQTLVAVGHAPKCGRTMALGLTEREPYQWAERAGPSPPTV